MSGLLCNARFGVPNRNKSPHAFCELEGRAQGQTNNLKGRLPKVDKSKSAGFVGSALRPPKGLSTAAKAEMQRARFVEEYLRDMNATQAAIRAGYAARSAASTASRLLKNAKVSAAVAAAMHARSQEAKTDALWLLHRLRVEADADMAECFDRETGLPKPIHEWPLVFRQGLVAGIDLEQTSRDDLSDEGRTEKTIGLKLKIRFADRTSVKSLIGKHVDVRAFDRTKTLDVKDNLIEEFASLIIGRSIRPGGGQ